MSKERKRLMEMHEQALDELAEMALDGDDGFGMDGEVDDFDALMRELDGEPGEDDGVGTSGLEGEEDENDDDDDDSEEDEDQGQVLADESESPAEPSSFSRIPTALVHNHLNLPTTAVPPASPTLSDFPNFSKTSLPYVIELNAGEMLYLPASWWHEVTSFSSTSDEGNGIHMAFNYWFYPPTSESFEEPYEDALVWEYLKGREKERASKASENKQERTGEWRVDGRKRKKADETLQNSKSKKVMFEFMSILPIWLGVQTIDLSRFRF